MTRPLTPAEHAGVAPIGPPRRVTPGGWAPGMHGRTAKVSHSRTAAIPGSGMARPGSSTDPEMQYCTKILNMLLKSLAVTFSKAKKKLYSAIGLANPFSCFANKVHSFRIFSTSSIHYVEKQHRTSTSCFHKSNTKFR